eukprot:TRINITY_DN4767_c0_g2_i1.p1 TRINITY_DN4767_c0_g2~~TRINITY_DN4767_c0_g2_i1.p1  ORF type:complete len:134 (-),score=18.21 TRINITY_DN4767_c0_g2_i1:998-1399(-)
MMMLHLYSGRRKPNQKQNSTDKQSETAEVEDYESSTDDNIVQNLTLMLNFSSGRDPIDQGWGNHPNITCDGCKQPVGYRVRYKCLACPDFDYCSDCEALLGQYPSMHPSNHLFVKLKDSRSITQDKLNSHVRL